MNINRFKNYGLWTAILAFTPMLLEGFGVNILPENYKEISTGLLSILVMAGILNNPTTESRGFRDDKIVPNLQLDALDEKSKKADEYYKEYDKVTQETIDKEKNNK